ncbi:PAAR domain-containing protein [Lysobacter soli]|uniref:PAAR domain-containing protein n=1 Tax=Lysobacter soli TaxID=453783 RepID=UPI0020A0C205|nr:PAAR domain-containing protein [Lysobacter soli]UTA52748.1 PAAR domain-containing protein [Lysobacter soli]
MAARYFIVVGDTTTGGGQAVEGYSGWKVECLDGSSRSVVRVGDQVLCGQCGPTTAIEGYAFAFVPSGLLAYDNCALACGHKLISKSQRLFSWDDPQPSTSLNARTTQAALQKPPSSNSSSQYSVQFVVHDAKGEPIPNFEYVLVDSVGNELTGTTDNLGQTARHYTSVYTQFQLYPKRVAEDQARNTATCREC